jgi:hypothetical protein
MEIVSDIIPHIIEFYEQNIHNPAIKLEPDSGLEIRDMLSRCRQ